MSAVPHRTQPGGAGSRGAGTDGQIPLPFQHRESLGGEDFLVAPCNEEAVAWIDTWPDWPHAALAVAGPPGAGKTHLAAVWAARADARPLVPEALIGTPTPALADCAPLILDNADAIARDDAMQRGLFHLLNRLHHQRGQLLLVAETPPARWAVALPDLASRLAAVPVSTIGAPDESLIGGLLVKLFADRQLDVRGEVLSYMIARMERSFRAASVLVAEIDRRALAEGRSITIPFVRAVMTEIDAG